jgi:polysaccharide biosynthesis protein PelE
MMPASAAAVARPRPAPARKAALAATLARALAVAAALGLEALAALAFASGPGTAVPWAAFLGPHLAACAALGLAFLPFPPENHKDWFFPAFAAVLCLALPVLGALAILLAVLPALGPAREERRLPYGVIRRDRQRPAFQPYAFRHGPGGFRARLLARGIPARDRLGALLSIRRRSTPRGNRLLREMLRDPADELRLAAYAALERMERDSQTAIAAAEADLRSAPDAGSRTAARRRLAFLYWEAAYQELADREVSRHHLERALESADKALAADPGDAFLALLKGRILARLGAWDEAHTAFASAEGAGAGAMTARLLPHQAELAFQRRDFGSVRSHLAGLRGQAGGGPLEPVLRFWLDGEG